MRKPTAMYKVSGLGLMVLFLLALANIDRPIH